MIDLALILAGGAFAIAAIAAAGFLIAPRTALPLSVRFVIGGAGLSVTIFLLLAASAGFRPLFVVGGAVLIVFGFRARARSPELDPLPPMPVFHRAILGIAGLIYLIYALAPETLSDATGYHLGLVAEYVRNHRLTRRVGFYELLPQSVEMLFVPAFMIGAHSAAKLVHFAFLLAAIPLFRHVARELQVGDSAACTAAVLFILSPVAAVTGTSAYTDLALVCACATVLYLLPRWNRERTSPLLLAAGLAAGFCYTVKATFGIVALAGIVYVAFRARRAKPVMLFTAAAAAVALPWVIRSYALTGNPFAPLVHAGFPNDGLPPTLTRDLFSFFSVFASNFSWRMAWPNYTLFGGEGGVLGPAYVVLPLALFALRWKSGRRLLASTLVLALPIIPNAGTRFLMPAMVPATIAFCSLLPTPLAAGLIAIQAVGALRPVIRLYSIHEDWMVPEFPLRAALRIEPERAYLRRTDWLYTVDEMIVAHSDPDAKILALGPWDQAYVPREAVAYWQSALASTITDRLTLARQSPANPAARVTLRFEPGQYEAFRLTALSDIKLLDTRPVPPPVKVWPAKTFLKGEAWSVPIPPGAAHLDLLVYNYDPSSLKVEARPSSGAWAPADARVTAQNVLVDLRRRVTADTLAQGFNYILVPIGSGSFSEIGMDMARSPAEWGVSLQGKEKEQALFQILPGDPSAPLRRLDPGSSGAWDQDDAAANTQPTVKPPAAKAQPAAKPPAAAKAQPAAIAQPDVKPQPPPAVTPQAPPSPLPEVKPPPPIENSSAGPCNAAMIDDSGNGIDWHGRWTTVQHFGDACNGTLTFASTAGASATFAFTGTGVTWVYAAASNGGRAQIRIDDRSVGVVDQYWPCKTQEPGCVSIRWHSQADFGDLAPGPHVVRIDALHEKSPDSADYGINVDGFIVR